MHVEYAGWCGPCSASKYDNGIATNEGGTWHQVPMTYSKADGSTARMPKRYITNLPTTISADLLQYQDGGDTWLYDGTFGRGIWKVKIG